MNNFTYYDPELPLGVRAYQMKEEFEALVQMYSDLRPTRVLEIGTNEGGTLRQWAKHAVTGAKIVACDLFVENNLRFKEGYQKIVEPFDVEFHFIQGNSHSQETYNQITSIASKYDFIFLDGDHTYAGIRKDFEMYSPLVRSGGLIALHDILPHPQFGAFCEVDVYWRQLKKKYRCTELLSEENQKHCGIGVVHV